MSKITFATLRQGTRLDNGQTLWFATVGKPGLVVASNPSPSAAAAMQDAKASFKKVAA